MTATQVTFVGMGNDVLEDAIREQRLAVLTEKAAGGWRSFRARFVSGGGARGAMTLESRPKPEELVPPPPRGAVLGITFRAGHNKCMFSAEVLESLPEQESFSLRLSWPTELQKLSRRAFDRAAPPRSMVIPVRFWPAGSDPSSGTEVRYGQLEDLSAGGVRVRAARTEGLTIGDLYRCSFTPRPGSSILVDATLRHRELGDKGRSALGFQFLGLEASEEGRKLLEKIAKVVGQFHRTRGPQTSQQAASCPGETARSGGEESPD